MAGDVPPRPPTRIELLQAAMEVTDQPLRPRPQRRSAVAPLAEHDREHVGDRTLLDHDRAIHIGVAESELGIEEDGALGGARGETDCHRRAGCVAEGQCRSPRGRDPKIPGADQFFQCHPKQPIHRPPSTRIFRFGPAMPPTQSGGIGANGFGPPPGPGPKAFSDRVIKTKSYSHGNAQPRNWLGRNVGQITLGAGQSRRALRLTSRCEGRSARRRSEARRSSCRGFGSLCLG